MDLKQIAMFAWMPFLAADFGCVFGGLVAMRLQKQFGLSVINSRRCAFTLGAFLMLGVGFVGFVQSPYAAIALAQPGRFRASDTFGNGDHHVVRPVSQK